MKKIMSQSVRLGDLIKDYIKEGMDEKEARNLIMNNIETHAFERLRDICVPVVERRYDYLFDAGVQHLLYLEPGMVMLAQIDFDPDPVAFNFQDSSFFNEPIDIVEFIEQQHEKRGMNAMFVRMERTNHLSRYEEFSRFRIPLFKDVMQVPSCLRMRTRGGVLYLHDPADERKSLRLYN
ncbi:MAG: hypothetical protein V1866_04810 [archaeon]